MEAKVLITIEIETKAYPYSEKSAFKISKTDKEKLERITEYYNKQRRKAKMKTKTLSEQLMTWLLCEITEATIKHDKLNLEETL